MKSFTAIEAVAVPLLRHNIDTDVIIPMKRLLGTSREALYKYALEPLRFDDRGAERADCILNFPAFRNAGILIAGRNFGCGSSREAAVVALFDMGLRCIIAPSFGDIFLSNCAKNGLLALTLPESQIVELAAEAETVAGRALYCVDLTTNEIRKPDNQIIAFSIDAGDRENLLSGIDEIERTLLLGDEIEAFQKRDRLKRPWVYGICEKTDSTTP